MEIKDEMITVLENYERIILDIIGLFMLKFGERNPIKKWRRGLIERVGFLDGDNSIEYSLHGMGCTVEFSDGKIISFDFDEDDMYVYTPFKLKLFIDSSFKELKFLTLDEIRKLLDGLLADKKILVVKNEGIRLNSGNVSN